MLKNIKLFSTDSDRTTYESSASYETPYVSKVTADNSVHYNKQIRIINFTVAEKFMDSENPYGDWIIRNATYQAEEGMTWNEWVQSEYNINYYFNNDNINYNEDNEQHIPQNPSLGHDFRIDFNSTPVLPEDTIVENRLYTTTYNGSAPG